MRIKCTINNRYYLNIDFSKCLIFQKLSEQEELILNLNDKSTDVYFIVQGEVRVTVFSESGRRVIMRDLKPGDHFGEYAAIDGDPRSATIVAMNRTIVAQMPSETFNDLLVEHPVLALSLIHI